MRIYTVYVPNPNRGPYTVYSQQEAFFTEHAIPGCPRGVLMDDLAKDIKAVLDGGDQVIVMTDSNNDIRKGKVNTALTDCGLFNFFTDRFNSDDDPLPKTYIDGRRPVDVIYVSAGLRGSRGGYFPASDDPGNYDHLLGWIAPRITETFGNHVQSWSPKARRLKTDDPRVLQKYNDYLHQFYTENAVYAWADSIKKKKKMFGLSPKIMYECEMMEQLCRLGMGKAEKKCRKIRKGGIDHSLKLKKLMLKVGAWKAMRDKVDGKHHMGRQKYRRTLKQGGLGAEEKAFPNWKVHLKTQEAIDELRRFKKVAKAERKTWLEDLAEAKAAVGDITAEKIIKQIRQREKVSKGWTRIKAANHKTRLGQVTRVERPNGNRTYTECTTQDAIHAACFANNKEHFWQANHTPFMQEPIQSKVGRLGTGPGAEEILNT